MPDYSSTAANFPASLANTLPLDETFDIASDRDGATPEMYAAAHGAKLANEVRAVQLYVLGTTGLQVTDNGGLEIAFAAGRLRYGNGAPIDISAGTLTLADDDVN